MKGKYRVVVKNNKLHYELELKRNITIIKGNSATGKTKLVNMIRQFADFGISSGIEVISDVPCRVLEGQDWQLILKNISGKILFIDEENGFIRSEAFAAAVRESDNYFVLITRENLYNLPYSVEEIYGIHSSGKYQSTKRVYQQMYRIYSEVKQFPIEPKCIIVEDSNSGYDFFKTVSSDKRIKCISAGGKTKLFAAADEMREETCVIADGAAIGAEMEKLFDLATKRKNIKLYLPESFEWIILNSGLFHDKETQAVLGEPENYIESQEYFSWERFFTRLLVHKTEDTYLKYQKSQLNPAYLHEKNKNIILNSISGIKLN